MNFNRVNSVASTSIDAVYDMYVVAELTLNSRDDRPRDQHGSFVTRTGKEMRNVEKKGDGSRIVFLKESLVFKGATRKRHDNATLTSK